MAVYQSADVYADMKCSKSKLPRDSAVALPQIQCCGTASDTQADQKGRGALRTHPLHVCQIPNSSY